MTAAIEVQNLRYAYKIRGKPAVLANDDLNFTVKQGEIFGLLGHNGAGKTTLVMQLMGLLTPQSGRVLVEGLDAAQDSAAIKSQVGYLPQTQLPLRYLQVRQALHFTGRLRGLPEVETRQQVEWLIEALDLGSFATSYVNKLSGGMLRITNFAMALMGLPRVLILDEPTNNLDPERRQQMWDMIQYLNTTIGLTCVLVTHNIAEAEQVIHRVLVLQSGKIVAQGTPGEIKQHVSEVVQLDIWLKTLAALPPNLLAHGLGTVEKVRDGHYAIRLPKAHAQMGINLILEQIGFDELDDFRVGSPSLEDVYLNLNQSVEAINESQLPVTA